MRSLRSLFILIFISIAWAGGSFAGQTVRVGGFEQKPFVSFEGGKASGLFVDVLDDVARQEGWALEYISGTFPEMLSKLENGDVDILLPIGYSGERAKKFSFTRSPLFIDWGIVYQKSGAPIRTIFDLQGRAVSCLKDSLYTEAFKSLLQQFQISAEFIERDNYADVFKDVEHRLALAGVATNLNGLALENKFHIQRTQIIFSPIKTMFALKKGAHPELLTALDRRVDALLSDNESLYYRQLRKYFSTVRPDQVIPYWLLLSAGVGAALCLVLLLFSILLRRQVAAKTAELMASTRALHESQRLLQDFLDASPALIYGKDVQGRVIVVNKALCDLFGFEAGKVIGKTTHEILPREFADKYVASDNKVLIDGETCSFEEEFVKDGVRRTYISVKFPLYDPDNKVYGVGGISSEITDRKRVEEDLLISEARFKESQMVAGLGYYVLDMKEGKWAASSVLDHLFGIDAMYPHTLQGWIALIHPDDRDRMQAYFSSHIVGKKQHFDNEYRIRRVNDGQTRWVHGLGKLKFDKDGNIVSMFGTIQDITSRKFIEEELRLYREHLEDEVAKRTMDLARSNEQLVTEKKSLEETNQALKLAQAQLLQVEKLASLGQLAAGVAHEINNPLGYITNNLSALDGYARSVEEALEAYVQIEDVLKEVHSPKAEEMLRYLTALKEKLSYDDMLKDFRQLIFETNDGVGRVKKIVQELRSFARSGQGLPELAHINDILKFVLSVMSNRIWEKADVTTELGETPRILCYPQQLEQVFINLVINAAQSMTEKGKITLKAYEKDGFVVVEVKDTGCGIPEDVLPRIFDPFFTTKEVGQGMGLGLSIVYGIVKKHGGDIGVESKVGEGTAVFVRLPVKNVFGDQPPA